MEWRQDELVLTYYPEAVDLDFVESMLRAKDARGLDRRFGFAAGECSVRRVAQPPAGSAPGDRAGT